MVPRILFATDGGEPARHAAAVLDAVFKRGGVHVVSVVSAPRIMLAEARADAERTVAEAAAGLAASGFQTEVSTPEGHPGKEIVRLATAMGADLIVVGAGNHRWLERAVMGSVSTRVLHTAHTSVLVVHDAPVTSAPATVVVGVDGSEHADVAIERIIEVLDTARIRLVVEAVAQYAVSFSGPAIGYATAGPTPAIEEELIAGARHVATRAVEQLRDAGFDAEPVWEMGPAVSCLLDRAGETSAALVAVGSRGLGPVDRAILGSVSDGLARHAPATLVAR